MTRAGVLVDALGARFGGTAYAAVEVARELAADARIGAVTVVAREGSLVAEGVGGLAGVRLVALPRASRLELARRVVWEAAVLPRVTRSAAGVLSWSGMLPRVSDARVVAYFANPLMFARDGAGDHLRRAAARRTARRAVDVLVPTAALLEPAAHSLRRCPSVVPLGVDHARFSPARAAGHEVLCVGDMYPHKRLDLVIDAWSLLPEPRPPLRLIGDPAVDPGHARRVSARVTEARRHGEVVLESGLAPEAVVDAYRRARVLVVASEAESFSMPLTEALACGVPAVVRDLPALRETGGAGTTYVAGDDPRSWAASVSRLLADDTAHADARAVGIDHASQYRWDRTAAAVADRLVGVPRSR